MALPTLQDLERMRDEAVKDIDPNSSDWLAFMRYCEARTWILCHLAASAAESERAANARAKLALLNELKDLFPKRNTFPVSNEDPS